MYLEISGRGTGKTHRLIQAAKEYVYQDPRNVPNIIVPTKREAEFLKEFIETAPEHKNDGVTQQFNYAIPENKNAIVRGYSNVRNFFDEFDHMDLTFKDVGFSYEDDYFVTTPARIRDLSKISIQDAAKNDLLLRLILENNGRYWVNARTMDYGSFIDTIKKNMSEEAFEMEIEGKFFKY